MRKRSLILLRLILLALMFLVTGCAGADMPTPVPGPVILTDTQGEYPLGLHLDLLEDPTGHIEDRRCSLLKFQGRYTTDPATRDLLQESQNRIRSMALIHEKLYQSPDLAHINFADYVRSLTGYLFRSYSVDPALTA